MREELFMVGKLNWELTYEQIPKPDAKGTNENDYHYIYILKK